MAPSVIGGEARVEMGSEPGTVSSDTAERCGGSALVKPATGESAGEIPSSASGEQSAAAASGVEPSVIGGEARVEMGSESGTVSSDTAER